MINRRALCSMAASGLLEATFGIAAQQPAKLPRIGFLGMDSGMQATRVAAFQDELETAEALGIAIPQAVRSARGRGH